MLAQRGWLGDRCDLDYRHKHVEHSARWGVHPVKASCPSPGSETHSKKRKLEPTPEPESGLGSSSPATRGTGDHDKPATNRRRSGRVSQQTDVYVAGPASGRLSKATTVSKPRGSPKNTAAQTIVKKPVSMPSVVPKLTPTPPAAMDIDTPSEACKPCIVDTSQPVAAPVAASGGPSGHFEAAPSVEVSIP